jgi:hypothetical protein
MRLDNIFSQNGGEKSMANSHTKTCIITHGKTRRITCIFELHFIYLTPSILAKPAQIFRNKSLLDILYNQHYSNIVRWSTSLIYATWGYATWRYATWRYATWRYATWRCATWRYATYSKLLDPTRCYSMLPTLLLATRRYTTLRCVTLYVTLCYAILRIVELQKYSAI